jgi:hypothetical protein
LVLLLRRPFWAIAYFTSACRVRTVNTTYGILATVCSIAKLDILAVVHPSTHNVRPQYGMSHNDNTTLSHGIDHAIGFPRIIAIYSSAVEVRA